MAIRTRRSEIAYVLGNMLLAIFMLRPPSSSYLRTTLNAQPSFVPVIL